MSAFVPQLKRIILRENLGMMLRISHHRQLLAVIISGFTFHEPRKALPYG
jgi:hypothetical protein